MIKPLGKRSSSDEKSFLLHCPRKRHSHMLIIQQAFFDKTFVEMVPIAHLILITSLVQIEKKKYLCPQDEPTFFSWDSTEIILNYASLWVLFFVDYCSFTMDLFHITYFFLTLNLLYFRYNIGNNYRVGVHINLHNMFIVETPLFKKKSSFEEWFSCFQQPLSSGSSLRYSCGLRSCSIRGYLCTGKSTFGSRKYYHQHTTDDTKFYWHEGIFFYMVCI